MAYLGNQPALSYTSFAKQDFTTSATTSYTLDNPVANANELALFINFVRQEPTTAYSASGTSLTLTSATSASDDMYCVFLGKAIQTVNPPNSSVGASQIVDASITSAKLASGVLPDNTPAFEAYASSSQSGLSDAVWTKLTIDSELFDTDGNFASSRFTPTTAGKYFVYLMLRMYSETNYKVNALNVSIYKNGSSYRETNTTVNPSSDIMNEHTATVSAIIDFNGSTDYVEGYTRVNVTSGTGAVNIASGTGGFGAYKILT
jgi:hypothetical protein